MRYGACSSVVERQIVDLVVVGSIPTRHPLSFLIKRFPADVSASRTFGAAPNPAKAFIAQLDRATDFESVGCVFESR